MNIKLLKNFKIALATAIIFANIAAVNSQNALYFDGTDDRVTCGNDTSVQITGKLLTLEAWVYPTSFKTNPWDCNVICKEDNSANYGYMLRVGGSGQHAVFGGDPATALPLEKARHPFLHRGRAKDFGIPETDQHRALGVFGITSVQAHRPKLCSEPAAGTASRWVRLLARGCCGLCHVESPLIAALTITRVHPFSEEVYGPSQHDRFWRCAKRLPIRADQPGDPQRQ